MIKMLTNTKISLKLPLIIVAMIVLATSSMGFVGYTLSKNAALAAAEAKLQAMAVSNRLALTSYLENIKTTLWTEAENPLVSEALASLFIAFEEIESPVEVLQQAYITDNPHPFGEKENLDTANTDLWYDLLHSRFHPHFRDLQQRLGYNDILLFDNEGNLVYSVLKELDFATNVATGQWRDSGLANAYRAAAVLEKDQQPTFIDFSPYAPSADTPAAFIAAPIFSKDGARQGVLAFRMPIDRINAKVQEVSGAGKTGGAYVVGNDGFLRTDSLLTLEDDILTTRVPDDSLKTIENGEAALERIVGFNGEPVLARYEPMPFLGTSLTMVVTQDAAEILSPIIGLRNVFLLLGGVLTLVFGTIALFFSRSISSAVRGLTAMMKLLADGDNEVEITGQERGDELGEMARATEVFKQNAHRVTALNLAQDAASKEMAEMAAEREKAALREVEVGKEKEASDRLAAEAREAMMIDLKNSFGTVVKAAIDGEYSKRVDAKFPDQILNELAENINQLLSTVDLGLSETGQVLERVAEGDLTQRMEGDFRGAFGHLQGNVNNMMEALKTLIVEISGSGNTLGSSSAELRDTSGALSRQAEQNAASLEEASAALQELSTSIKQVGDNVTDANKNAQIARDMAQSSEKIAADAALSMDSIADSSKEITRVVSVIDDISFQINLLSLNAGVEAARAGEAGRGFAVVASEVRQLAQKASEASQTITTVITKSDVAVSEGVEKVASARSSLKAISESVISISAGVDEISTTISEQVNGISEISSAVGQIDKNSQKQAASFEELTAASSVLASEADRLTQSTERFRTGQRSKVVTLNRPTPAPPKIEPKITAVGGGVNHEGWDEF